jgi:hypothetical protein
MDAFNKRMSKLRHYPIEINFYEDAAWDDFETLREQFDKKQ